MLPIFITVTLKADATKYRINVGTIIRYWAEAKMTAIATQDTGFFYATELPEEIDALIEQAKHQERDYLLAALDDLRIALEGRK